MTVGGRDIGVLLWFAAYGIVSFYIKGKIKGNIQHILDKSIKWMKQG